MLIIFHVLTNGSLTTTYITHGQLIFGYIHRRLTLLIAKFLIQTIYGNYWKHIILKHTITPQCLLCPHLQNNIWLHILTMCSNPQHNNLCTNWHKKATHAILSTLKKPPTYSLLHSLSCYPRHQNNIMAPPMLLLHTQMHLLSPPLS